MAVPNYVVELTKGEVSTILFHLEEATKDKLDGEFPEEIQTIFSKLEGAVDAHFCLECGETEKICNVCDRQFCLRCIPDFCPSCVTRVEYAVPKRGN